MSRWTIRSATPDDAPAIADVHRRSSPDAADHSVHWRTRLSNPAPASAGWVAEDDAGAVVGFCLAGPSPDDGGASTGHVHALYVLPGAAGQGIGSALLAASLRHLRETGFSEATLWVGAGNEHARAFYAARGWRPDGAMYEDATPGGFAVSLRYRRLLARRRRV